jgi:sister chromatid cohesion protein DCC1
VGIEEDDLIENTQASKVEIHAALADGPAFRDPNRGGRWRGIDDTYAAHVLEMLVVTAQAKGMALDAVDEAGVKSAMATDDPPTPEPVTQYVLRMYSEPAAGDGGARVIDAKKVCRSVASRMLEGSKPAAAGRLRLGEFLTAWRDGCNEELRAACTRDLLKGLALIEKGASGKEEEALVRVFRDVDLPKQPRDRFRALFALKPRWQMDELEHYIAATSDETIEAQLLKYTRVSQPTTDAVPIYSKR